MPMISEEAGARPSTRFIPPWNCCCRRENRRHPSFFETMTAMAFVAFAPRNWKCGARTARRTPRRTNLVDPELVSSPDRLRSRSLPRSSIESIAAKSGHHQARKPAVFSPSAPPRSACWNAAHSKWRLGHAFVGVARGRSAPRKFGSRFTLVLDEEIPIQARSPGHQVENARTGSRAQRLRLIGIGDR